MASKQRIGLRALTMQQPFAAALAAGVGLYSRRGRATKFGHQAKHKAGERAIGPDGEGEWLAIHCGQNNEHLNNGPLMKRIREFWPECPSNEELKAAQRCILGVALFVDGTVAGRTASAACPVLREYPCSKPIAWRASEARALKLPVQYPKGQVQVWHVFDTGFVGPHGQRDAGKLLALTTTTGKANASGGGGGGSGGGRGEQAGALGSPSGTSKLRGVKPEPSQLQKRKQRESTMSSAKVKEEQKTRRQTKHKKKKQKMKKETKRTKTAIVAVKKEKTTARSSAGTRKSTRRVTTRRKVVR